MPHKYPKGFLEEKYKPEGMCTKCQRVKSMQRYIDVLTQALHDQTEANNILLKQKADLIQQFRR